MALSGVVKYLLKSTRSRASALWCSGTMALGAGLCMAGLWWNSVHGWLDLGIAGMCLWGVWIQALALRHVLNRPLKMAQAWLAYAVLSSLAAALAQGLPNQALVPSGLLIALAGSCLWAGLLARDIRRRQDSAAATCMALAFLTAALALALVSVLLASGRSPWPNGHAPHTWLWVAAVVLVTMLAHLGFLGLKLDDMNRQIHALRTDQAHQTRLIRLNEQMAHIDRHHGLGGMAASLAHELSQPLTNLYLITDRLEMEVQDKGPDTLTPYIQDLQRNAQKAGDLVSRIRSFVSSENGPHPRVQIQQVMLDAQQLASSWTWAEGVQMHVSWPEDTLFVHADAAQLVQILAHVLRNALQATLPQSTRRVDFRAWRSGATVHLAITDNGPGMTAEVYRQVSSAFFSAPSQGVGLGLSLAQSLAKRNGGRLVLAEHAGSGACIELQLPAAD